jgi:DNA-binding NtrC family response regulator
MAREHRVLVIEDDEGLRYAFTRAFEKVGLAVDSTGSGRDAVDILNRDSEKYCCVTLDMLLPSVHGSSVIAHVARTNPRLAILAITGYPDRVLFADQADRHVVKAIFVKPVETADVAAYVASRCSREE